MRFCSAFVDAMADANEVLLRLAEEDDTRKNNELSSFVAKRQEYDRAWMAAADWPSSQVSTWNKLTRMGAAMVPGGRANRCSRGTARLCPSTSWYPAKVHIRIGLSAEPKSARGLRQMCALRAGSQATFSRRRRRLRRLGVPTRPDTSTREMTQVWI
jgi:hypothetical protein